MMANSRRPMATWRSATGTMSPTSAKEIGTTPPAASPATMRAATGIEVRRETADERRRRDQEHAQQRQPGLAEHVGKRAEQRLHQCIRQRESGGEQRRGRRLDVQPVGNQRNDRIGRADEQRAGKNDKRQ